MKADVQADIEADVLVGVSYADAVAKAIENNVDPAEAAVTQAAVSATKTTKPNVTNTVAALVVEGAIKATAILGGTKAELDAVAGEIATASVARGVVTVNAAKTGALNAGVTVVVSGPNTGGGGPDPIVLVVVPQILPFPVDNRPSSPSI